MRKIAKNFIPPVFIHIARQIKNIFCKPEWEYIPQGWVYVDMHPEVKGWNVPDILEVYKRKWPKFVEMLQGPGLLGIAHESNLATGADINNHNAIMSFAYSIALAACGMPSLSMLDWGGGIGHYYFMAEAVLPGVKIDYHCKDVPLLAEYGAKLFPQGHFYKDESCFERTYDFVMAGVSLHYSEDWQVVLDDLAKATIRYLYVAQLPVVRNVASFVFVQRPYRYGYNTEYLAWCLNREDFLRHAERLELELVREFVYGLKPLIYNAPEQNEYRGYLFKPANKQG